MHPYIAALTQAPYKYEIFQVDPADDEQYTFDCGEGVELSIHVMKPPIVWKGTDKNGKDLKRTAFPKIAKEKAGRLIMDFDEVRKEIGTVLKSEPKASEKLSEPVNHDDRPKTKQTQLTVSEKAVAVSEPTRQVGFSFTDRQIEAMKQTVAKGATQAEFEMFIYLAMKYKLDPFLKEIFFIPGNMKTVMTSRDGYLKIAQNHKSFEGIRSMAVRANDDFEVDLEHDTVKHKFGKGERGQIIGAWAIVYRKGRRPVIAFADLSEYQGQTQPWKKYTSAMICKCAEVFALKRQFSIDGLVTAEEMDVDPKEIVDPEHVMKNFDLEDITDADFEEVEEE